MDGDVELGSLLQYTSLSTRFLTSLDVRGLSGKRESRVGRMNHAFIKRSGRRPLKLRQMRLVPAEPEQDKAQEDSCADNDKNRLILEYHVEPESVLVNLMNGALESFAPFTAPAG